MDILIIGGTKFIGKALAEKAISENHKVTLFNRGQSPHSVKAEVIVGDVNNITAFKSQLLERDFDVVIHCIAYTEKHAKDIVSIFDKTDAHLIVLGSGDCYEAFQGLNRKVDKAELPITESSPLSSMKYYWSDLAAKGSLSKDYDKNLMADVLMTAHKTLGLKITIFRLSMIYGPGDYQYPGRHGAFIRRIIDKRKTLTLTDREQCQVYTYGYIENIAAAIIHSLNMKICFGKSYNLGESKSRSRRRWAELYAEVADWEFDYHILPEELTRKDKSFRNAPPQHMLTDSSLFCAETDFVYPVPLEIAVKRTLLYAFEHPEVLGDADDYEEEDRLLASYYSKIDEIHSESFCSE